MKEYIITFIRVKGKKLKSAGGQTEMALNTNPLSVDLWQNACLNFCAIYPNDS